LAIIGGHKHIRLEIVVAMTVKSGIGCSFLMVGGYYSTDIGLLWNSRDLIADILPGLTSIPRDLEISIVCANIEETLLKRRFRNGNDITIEGDPIMTGEGLFVGKHTHQRELLSVLFSGKVDGLFPGLSSIFGYEEFISPVVDGLWVMRRDQDGRVPVETISLLLILGFRPNGFALS
jgi:hypothetical protein